MFYNDFVQVLQVPGNNSDIALKDKSHHSSRLLNLKMGAGSPLVTRALLG